MAIAALRSPARTLVTADDHAAVLKIWVKRHRDLARLRCQAACRLHATLCQIIPGGVSKAITAAAAAALLEANPPAGPVAAARHQVAAELAADLRRLDGMLAETRKTITAAVGASGSTVTSIFGVGPIIAATVLGDVADVTRFPSADQFAAYNGTAPVEVSSGKRKVFRLSGAATGASTTPSTWPPSPRSGSGTATAAPTTTRNEPRARPARKRSAPSNGKSATPSTASSKPTPAAPAQPARLRAREGNRGTTLHPARPATPRAPALHVSSHSRTRHKSTLRRHADRLAANPDATQQSLLTTKRNSFGIHCLDQGGTVCAEPIWSYWRGSPTGR